MIYVDDAPEQEEEAEEEPTEGEAAG